MEFRREKNHKISSLSFKPLLCGWWLWGSPQSLVCYQKASGYVFVVQHCI